MSTISQNNKKKKKLRFDKTFFMRILVLLLVIGTLAGTFYYAIYFLFVGGMRVNGQENTEAPEDGYLVRVALEYGSSVAASYRTAAENGYIYGTENSDNVMTEMGTLPYPSLHVAYEQNLVKNADGNYEAPTDGKAPLVGCYHINIETTQTAPFGLIADRVRSFLGEDTVIFRSVTIGKEVLSVGQYGTESEAKAAKAKLDELINAQYVVPEDTTSEDTSSPETTVPEETTADETTSPDGTSSSEETAVPEETTSVESTSPEETAEPETTTAPETEPEEPEPKEPDEAEKLIISGVIPKPDQDALILIDEQTDGIVLRFSDPTGVMSLALRAIQTEDKLTYILGYKSSGMRKYDGVLEFKAISGSDYRGVRVIDVLPLETYIMGVVPYEIGNLWPLESQKAFSIAVRSYVVANLGKHKKSYDADVCSSTDCQVYKGFGSTNSMVRQACTETKGLIAVCDGKICNCMYSSSTGGCTANVNEVYGSSTKTYPYLVAVATPWEKYETHGNGSWSYEVSPSDLYSRLKSCGYAVTGKISSVTLTLGKNTSYVYKASFTDVNGVTVSINQGSKVKSALSPYLKSGNFIIGKAGDTVSRRDFTMLGFNATSTTPSLGIDIKTNPFDVNLTGRRLFTVLTAEGKRTFVDGNSESVMTASGVRSLPLSQLLDSSYYPTILGSNNMLIPDLSQMKSNTETVKVKLEGTKGNFVIVGRGWGHGLGMSQYGTYDMAKAGYGFETIFKSYYTGAEIMSFVNFLAG